MLTRPLSHFALVSLVLAGTLPASFGRSPGAPLKPGWNLFSKQQDVQLGQEAAQQVRQQMQVVQDPMLQDYINRVGQRLASTQEARASGFPFTFQMVNDPSVNAFALPGGPMFINTGLLQSVDNEAQLAGVMAHEMSHVILRHGTNQASKANLIQLPAMLAGVIGGGGMLGQLAQLGVGLGANSVLLKFSRDAESQADALGSHMMSEAGYNPIEMARFFEKLQASSGARGLQILSDHPNPGNREAAIEAEIRTLPQRSYGFQTGEFERAKQELGSVPRSSGRSIRGSNALPNGQPTGGMQQLNTQYFSLAYPGNWKAYGGKDSGGVTIAPENGLVQGNRGGGTAVGYGAILSYFFPENGNQLNLQRDTTDLVNHLHADNPALQLASNSRRVTVDRHEGLITMLRSDSPFGGAETDALLTVATQEGLFYMVFVAPEAQFRNLQSAFDQMVQSIHFAA